jgi:hypothetical protein
MKKAGHEVKPGDRIRLKSGTVVNVTRTQPVGLSLAGGPPPPLKLSYPCTELRLVGTMVAFAQDRVDVLSP